MNTKITILLVLISFLSSAQAMVPNAAQELEQLESRLKKMLEEVHAISNDPANLKIKVEADCKIDMINFLLDQQIPFAKKQLLASQNNEKK